MSAEVFCPRCGVLNALDSRVCRECRASLASGVLPASAPVDEEVRETYPDLEPRPCPVCGEPMDIGEVFLAIPPGWVNAMFTNRGYLELFFRRKGRRMVERLLGPRERVPADRCWPCNVVMIQLPQDRR